MDSADSDVSSRRTVKITELHPSVPRDKSLVATEKTLMAGSELLESGRQGDLPAAFTRFQEAFTSFQATGERGRASLALRRHGRVLMIQGKRDEALSRFQEARQLVESEYGAEHIKVAPALVDLADLWARSNDMTKAHDLCEQALKIFERNGALPILSLPPPPPPP
jgi:tetratricopeptide (TPR) repeat protein